MTVSVTIEVTELDTTKVRVTTDAAKMTCSPFFAVTPVYCGKGTWDTRRWQLTHVPTGLLACYGPISGRDAVRKLRILAGVLTAYGDWSTVEAAKATYRAIPGEIVLWMGRLC